MVARKPLVSAAAVGTDGQLTLYCGPGQDVPCYRCLFPEAPAPENCSRCSDAGVLGVVPGVMGTLQALEAIKLVAGVGEPLQRKLLLFDALAARFTSVKLRGRSADCCACGERPLITAATLPAYDYVAFTGQPADDAPPPPLQLLPPSERLQPQQLQKLLEQEAALSASYDTAAGNGNPSSSRLPGLLLLDVRPSAQVAVMSLPHVHHVPFDSFRRQLEEVKRLCLEAAGSEGAGGAAGCQAQEDGGGCGRGETRQGRQHHVVVLCRRGNHSQIVAKQLRDAGISWATDVVGGYTAWAQEVDPTMPVL